MHYYELHANAIFPYTQSVHLNHSLPRFNYSKVLSGGNNCGNNEHLLYGNDNYMLRSMVSVRSILSLLLVIGHRAQMYALRTRTNINKFEGKKSYDMLRYYEYKEFFDFH